MTKSLRVTRLDGPFDNGHGQSDSEVRVALKVLVQQQDHRYLIKSKPKHSMGLPYMPTLRWFWESM